MTLPTTETILVLQSLRNRARISQKMHVSVSDLPLFFMNGQLTVKGAFEIQLLSILYYTWALDVFQQWDFRLLIYIFFEERASCLDNFDV